MMKMKSAVFKRILAATIALPALLGAGVLGAPAYAGGEINLCSLATLKGAYIGPASGTVFPPAFGVTETAVSEATGYSIFNGDGTGTDYVTFTINGVVIIDRGVMPFTYTLKSDCSGTRTVSNGGPHFNIYAAFDGSSVTEIATAPVGFAVTAIAQRIGQRPEQ